MAITLSLQDLGSRIAQHRLNKNMSQKELASRAGVSIATVKRIESGSHSTLLVNILHVLRALGLEQGMDMWIPETPPSPVQMANLRSHTRKRASRKTMKNSDETIPWSWSDK